MLIPLHKEIHYNNFTWLFIILAVVFIATAERKFQQKYHQRNNSNIDDHTNLQANDSSDEQDNSNPQSHIDGVNNAATSNLIDDVEDNSVANSEKFTNNTFRSQNKNKLARVKNSSTTYLIAGVASLLLMAFCGTQGNKQVYTHGLFWGDTVTQNTEDKWIEKTYKIDVVSANGERAFITQNKQLLHGCTIDYGYRSKTKQGTFVTAALMCYRPYNSQTSLK